MLFKLKRNMTIVNFCTGDLKDKQHYSQNAFLLLSNFSFILKSSLMQIIIVAFCSFPIPALSILIGLESVYVVCNIIQYSKNQHLKSFLLLVPRIVQSLLILTVEFCLLIPYWKLWRKDFSLSQSSQNTLMTATMISSFVEYGLLAINLGVIIWKSVSERKLKKANIDYKKFTEKKSQFLEFKSKSSEESNTQNFERVAVSLKSFTQERDTLDEHRPDLSKKPIE